VRKSKNNKNNNNTRKDIEADEEPVLRMKNIKKPRENRITIHTRVVNVEKVVP
jgi:hypothetical protein